MELKLGSHRNKALQNDWNTHGEGNFLFEVLSQLKDSEDENMDFQKELKVLQEMIVEELDLNQELYY